MMYLSIDTASGHAKSTLRRRRNASGKVLPRRRACWLSIPRDVSLHPHLLAMRWLGFKLNIQPGASQRPAKRRVTPPSNDIPTFFSQHGPCTRSFERRVSTTFTSNMVEKWSRLRDIRCHSLTVPSVKVRLATWQVSCP